MKKAILTIAMVLLGSVWINNAALAASFSAGLSGASEFSGSSFTVDVVVSGFSGFSQLYGFSANCSYDSSKITFTGVSALDGFNNYSNGSYLMLVSNSGSGGGSIARLSFSNKALGNGESATISLTGVTGSDNNVDIPAGGASKTVRYSKPADTTPTPTPTTPTPTPSTSTPSTSTNTNKDNSTTSEETPAETEDNESEETSTDTDNTDPVEITPLEETPTDNESEQNQPFPTELIWPISATAIALASIGANVYFIVIPKLKKSNLLKKS
jgi:hypothetical protein